MADKTDHETAKEERPARPGGITRRQSVAAVVLAAAAVIPTRRAVGAQSSEGASGGIAGEHRRSAAARITSVDSKLRHFAMAEQDYGLAPGGPAAANASALQRAVNDARIVILPDSPDPVEFSAPVVVPPYTQLFGAGAARTKLRSTGAHGFIFEAPRGLERLEGPKFAEFSMECSGSGIKLNDAAGGFTDTPQSQSYIMRARFERVTLTGSGTSSGIGIEMNKCFSAVIDQCEIMRFETGLKTLGCDFPAIVGRSRIWNCGVLVRCERSGTFGSGMLIDAADLLIPTRSFIVSSDHHLIVRNCYFEKPFGPALSGPVLDIEHSYMTLITGNRFEVPAPANPIFMRVNGEGSLFVFEQNSHRGVDWGEVSWNRDNSARYWFNQSIRQKIVVRDNFQKIAVPFSTMEDGAVRNERRDAWVLTPAVAGFPSPYNYSEHVRVADGAFVLPAARGYGSLIRFADRERPVSGSLSIYVLARANVNGTRLRVSARSGESGETPVSVALGDRFEWHSVYENVERQNLVIDMFNDDIERGGAAFIKMVTVERSQGPAVAL